MIRKDAPFDMTDVRYVKRITIGSSDPAQLRDETFLEEQSEILNRCLNEVPRGHIIGQEKNVNVVRLGEQQVVIQSIVYHVGFKRKPIWLEE